MQISKFYFVLFTLLVLTLSPALSKPRKTRIITDLAGRQVTLPQEVKRVACLEGNSYERVFMLGQVDKIAVRIKFDGGWAAYLNPNFDKIYVTTNYADPDVEELLAQGIDAVLYWDYPKPLEKMENAHLNPVVTQRTSGTIANVEEFKNYFKSEILNFGNVLGVDAYKNAQTWVAYFDKKADFVASRVAKSTESRKPRVYYVRGPAALVTHGSNSNTRWLVEMAGGELVSQHVNQGMGKVSMEDIMNWDPEVIFMGRVNNKELILDDPQWKNISAVKNNKVYVNPDGVRSWDCGGESILFVEFIAQKLYPDLFKDISMRGEIKEYYAQFYHYNLTDDEADRILHFMPPPVK